jgi:hypothetical protein
VMGVGVTRCQGLRGSISLLLITVSAANNHHEHSE